VKSLEDLAVLKNDLPTEEDVTGEITDDDRFKDVTPDMVDLMTEEENMAYLAYLVREQGLVEDDVLEEAS